MLNSIDVSIFIVHKFIYETNDMVTHHKVLT
jgi:hypothetical protein